MLHAPAVIRAQLNPAYLANIAIDVEKILQQTPPQPEDIGDLQSTVSFELLPLANALDKLHLDLLLSIHQNEHELKYAYSHSSMPQHQCLFRCPLTKTKAMIYSIAHAH